MCYLNTIHKSERYRFSYYRKLFTLKRSKQNVWTAWITTLSLMRST